ncbi:MAG: SAM-dependent methyltransferase [Zoogloeaceae bacterium]|jgi:SAM-dependent MidA family methyltransferase|nr:SAM-dependent methyltransferase [Zoogloeaceae bacterium]
MMSMPTPEPAALAHSAKLRAAIHRRIEASGGWISFADFMEMALYAPGLGYYVAGAQKFGAAGDFVTAPELTPLFAAALARQAAEIMRMSAPCILEAGAGSGRLAVDMLRALEAADALPTRYDILELSPELAARQRQTFMREAPRLLARVNWQSSLPARFSGLVLANEVLDAMPTHRALWQNDDILEYGVARAADDGFLWQTRPASARLRAAARRIADAGALPSGYVSEISLLAPAWVAAWGERLTTGCLLLADYGFPRREFYHPDRDGGTLMCHYRQYAHPDPFHLPGLQDISAHVDFTALIAAAHPAGLNLAGYTHQAQFLLNCGLLDDLAALEAGSPAYLWQASAAQKLIAPHEMGELFKVMALGKNLSAPLSGFLCGDKSCQL